MLRYAICFIWSKKIVRRGEGGEERDTDSGTVPHSCPSHLSHLTVIRNIHTAEYLNYNWLDPDFLLPIPLRYELNIPDSSHSSDETAAFLNPWSTGQSQESNGHIRAPGTRH